MFWGLYLPMLVTLLAAFGAAWFQRRLRPDWATWALTALAGGSALSVLWALGVLALGYAVEQPDLSRMFGWCRALFHSHDHVPPTLGIAAWILIAAMAASVTHETRRRRRAAADHDVDEIIESLEAVAFAVPGRPGRIIVSTGMLSALDPDEQRVLYAHERSHLHHHHHRFLHVAEAAAAAVPLLRPLSHQVRFATERWADEDAAAEVGDRRVVARAIARAGLAVHDSYQPAPALSLTGHGTRARVEAMLEPQDRHAGLTTAWVALGVAGIAVSLTGSTVQLHHLFEFLGHVCRLD